MVEEQSGPGHPVHYQLGPRSRRGLVAGWRGGQLGLVAIGLLLGVLSLRAFGGVLGALVAVLLAGGAIALCTWPVAGRTSEQWAPVLASHGARRATGLRRGRGAYAALELDRVGLPGGEEIGVVADAARGTWTAVMRIGGTGHVLGDADDQDRRIAAWSGVLAAMAREGGGVHRLQWLARSQPGVVDLDRALDTGLAAASYDAFVEEASPRLFGHEVLVALSVRAAPDQISSGSRGGSPRSRARSRRHDGEVSQLAEELASLGRRCRAAGLEVQGVLSVEALSGLLRRAHAVRGAPEGLADAWPWPLGVDDGWAALRTDATWHATYWVAEWPRSEVTGGFLIPLLLEGSLRRTVAVTMAPVPPVAATRRVEHDRTSGAADAELRRRHGFAVSARVHKEHEATVRRESEIAEGHAAFRFTGYLSVTADDESSLARDCARLEQVAAQSRLELHRLYGVQEDAFVCTLPTGRGCP